MIRSFYTDSAGTALRLVRPTQIEREESEELNKPLIVSTLLLFAVVASAQETVERDASGQASAAYEETLKLLI